MPGGQRRDEGDRAEGQDRGPERKARGRPRGRIAQAPEPEQRQQRECGLGQRDGHAEAHDERPEDGAVESGQINKTIKSIGVAVEEDAEVR